MASTLRIGLPPSFDEKRLSGKQKIFQDATQGYIQIPHFMVEKLIDTFELQRLKDVSQTGIRPIYSGATHDRFSHSVGVYNIGVEIYESFCKNLLADFCGDICECKKAKELLEKYRPYYYVACILHDIGHPALSHTFEYLYDNKYLQLDEKCTRIDKEEVQRLFELYCKHEKLKEMKIELREELFGCIDVQSGNSVITDGLRPSQHEMMGAYQILNDCAGIQKSINEVFEKWNEHDDNSIGMVAESAEGVERESEVDFVFIACMIIGAQYKLPVISHQNQEHGDEKTCEDRFELSLKNCIVRLLNGLIDADSIDYLNRNAHFAGYSTSNLDVVRLSNAFSAHYDPKRVIFESCLEKSAMSALEGFINARHFEPRWLYSHHKIIYYEAFLTKYLYKKSARYIYAMEYKEWQKLIPTVFQEKEQNLFGNFQQDCLTDTDWSGAVNGFVRELFENTKDIKKSEKYGHVANLNVPDLLCGYFVKAVKTTTERISGDPNGACQELNTIIETAKRWTGFCREIREAYRGYLVSPVGKFVGTGLNSSWYKSSDSDINTIFKQMYLQYKDKKQEELSAEEQEVNDRYDMFLDVLEEYHTRKYRNSLWKTEQEYQLFLADVQTKTGLSKATISDIFVDFIVNNGCCEEFDDAQKFNSKDKRGYKAVYLNYKEEELGSDRTQKYNKMFSFLGMGMVICIYEFRYKDFGNLKIRFKNGDNVRLVPYSELSEAKKKQKEYLPYIYYKKSDTNEENSELLQRLKEKLVEYILDGYGGAAMQTSNYYPEQGKIIRDPVHGDIFVPERFLKVIDTRVFQRLRRIKQLATADYVFPEACHTRFAHSLGTFHIMTLMLNRICSLFDYLHIEYTQTEKDAVLMAALLHDIGHGPYSHAFEKLPGNMKSHEEWTYDIIREDSELQAIFDNCFSEEFPAHVIGCLKNERTGPEGKGMLRYVFSSLISSQLDADRLDYLMRDSYNTGVKLGIVDLQKIIASLELTQYNGELTVCVAEDALSSIEQLILGRFNMYDTVYFAPYKTFSEQLLLKILRKISEGKELNPDSQLYKVLNNTLSLKEYIELDDSVIQSEIYQYRNKCKDPVIKEMINSFFNRRGYERLRIMDESVAANNAFVNAFEREFQMRIDDLYAFVYRIETFCAYKYAEKNNGTGAVLIVGRNGVVSDLFQKSKVIGYPEKSSQANTPKHYLETSRSCIYVNYEVLKMELEKIESDINVEKIKEFVDTHSLRRHTEIEEKYSCSADAIKKGKETAVVFQGALCDYYVSGGIKEKRQEDTYFDTDEFLLAQNDFSFRCRKLSDEDYIFTVKKSIDPNNGENGGQFIRSEFELATKSANLDSQIAEFIKEHLSELFEQHEMVIDLTSFKPKIIVKNNRVSYDVERQNSNFKCEVSLDSVEYLHEGKKQLDWQVEIELKSQDAIHRVELRDFAEKFGVAIGVDNRMREKNSKYRKALETFQLV